MRKLLLFSLIFFSLISCFYIIYILKFSSFLPKDKTASISPQQVKNSSDKPKTPKMSLHDKILSIMILHTPGSNPKDAASFISKYHPAGIILMDDNTEQVKELTAAVQQTSSPYPSLIAVDEEGCIVKRIASDNFLCANQLKNLPVSETKLAFQKRARMLQNLGINLNFGTVADVTNNEDSFIYPRVFGGDPKKVSDYVVASVQGSQPYVFSTLKHFPGHGRTIDNSHLTIPQILISEAEWESSDYLPFKAGIDVNAEFVMFGHLNYKNIDNNPASLSPKWHNILQTEAGFKGIAITDDMIMLQKSNDPAYEDGVKNAIQAINAGNNILLYVNDYNLGEEPVRHIDIDQLVNGIQSAIELGAIDKNKFNASVEKVLEVRSKLRIE